jgi:hypothetical protein
MTRLSMMTLAAVLTLSSALAMAQSGSHHSHAFRSAMNSTQSQHRASDRWSASSLNGHGINRLGVTTNSGRLYNGG